MSPLLSSIATVLLLIGGSTGAVALMRRPRMAPQYTDNNATSARSAIAPPNTGFGWGVDN